MIMLTALSIPLVTGAAIAFGMLAPVIKNVGNVADLFRPFRRAQREIVIL